MKISILIASSGREELFNNMLNSLIDTTSGYEIDVVAVLDGCIENELRVANLCMNYVMDSSRTRRGALWAWNRALQISTGDILVPAGDDQLFHPGWLDYALESHHTKLNDYGVVGMNDLAYDGNKQLATMFLFDRKYCKEVMGGIFAPPMYHYFNIDSEWNEKAKMLGHFYWDERSKIEHLHSAHGKRPLDNLDVEKIDNNWAEIDNKIFEDRKNRGFSIEWDSLI